MKLKEAIAEIKGLDVNVVVMDINMPKLDGYHCTEFIRQNYLKIKILVLSMSDDFGSIKKMLHAGAHGYIFKNVLVEKQSAIVPV